MSHFSKLTDTESETLLTLCRDDGYTVVTEHLVVQTSNLEAPNLGAIIDYLQSCQVMLGQDVRVEEVPQSMIEKALATQSEAALQTQQDDSKNVVEKHLLALCQTAVDRDSSDIHVLTTPDKTLFLLRIDGARRLVERFHNQQSAKNQPRQMGLALIDYVFSTLGGQDIKYTLPANDRFEVPLRVDGKVRMFEWRAALIPTHEGPKLTLRCLTPKNKALQLEDMDLPKPYLSTLIQMVHKRQGGIIITGPMGSGKSSLVYALLEKVDRVARNVHSLEDPVEFSQDFVSKTQVQPSLETHEGSRVKMDYAFYCKETLRHDVDLSNIGEIRDTPTAAEFCRKAETGGLALATLHTNSALGVAQTFIQQLKMPAAIVGAPDLMAMFVHVKLVRKLCDCAFSFADHHSEDVKNAYANVNATDKLELKISQLEKLCSEGELKSVRLLNPCGCDKCNKEGGVAGERGRLVVMEMIVLDDTDRQFIIKEDDLGWKKHLKAQGWPDIKDHCKSRIMRGQVDILSASEQVDDLVPVPVNDIYRELAEAL
ncbi:ATPase, T2SS/T4P/T4SS family [Vibrio parahaemolyticus]|uniref:GspE/PulE family protein n=1 Tax=Vibrio parahaemolyticus TaxID=670 RepID=UPI00186A7E15|nr:ATPase, T2SS/T4P/T4SS family [Vibrio parahaemolyticus]MBE3793571.1 Flp pilus assembly complex ATPase component TadA [Vibrio parahaemolyticus]MBE3866432.1 Flp pilus assembly complex ATPase component TadA [Vibrio parahaemolyticus]MCZ5880312.1 ATPase, T2SS/T4P/T4SS family [Vibrio parahaemolyticus]MDF4895846.1 ATPase, T2SS/T4P/T4SS family [Vibrio parahaemolyticus]UJX32793.1 Flp pilus assembly complex ATPase component TadA [Vibrio parahaemolyticus]